MRGRENFPTREGGGCGPTDACPVGMPEATHLERPVERSSLLLKRFRVGASDQALRMVHGAFDVLACCALGGLGGGHTLFTCPILSLIAPARAPQSDRYGQADGSGGTA